jgi:hypothetical protein
MPATIGVMQFWPNFALLTMIVQNGKVKMVVIAIVFSVVKPCNGKTKGKLHVAGLFPVNLFASLFGNEKGWPVGPTSGVFV